MKNLRKNLFEFDPSALQDFANEMDFLRKCRHRNIVRFFGGGVILKWNENIYSSNSTCAGQWPDGVPFLVAEYLAGGSLKNYLAKELQINWAQKISFCLDIQAAMQ